MFSLNNLARKGLIKSIVVDDVGIQWARASAAMVLIQLSWIIQVSASQGLIISSVYLTLNIVSLLYLLVHFLVTNETVINRLVQEWCNFFANTPFSEIVLGMGSANEMMLHCCIISHWLSPYPEWPLPFALIIDTVHPMKYARGFVVHCFAVFILSFLCGLMWYEYLPILI